MDFAIGFGFFREGRVSLVFCEFKERVNKGVKEDLGFVLIFFDIEDGEEFIHKSRIVFEVVGEGGDDVDGVFAGFDFWD